jgi:hypothetical protein
VEASTLDSQSRPSGLLLALASASVTFVGGVAWLLLAFEAILSAPWSQVWLWSGLVLPAAAIGAIATHQTRRWWPLAAGLAITLLPLLLFVVLPEPPPIGGADGVD